MKIRELPVDINGEIENRLELEIEDGYAAGERLDVLIAHRLPKISRSRVKKLIDEGRILLNKGKPKASTIVQGGAFIEITFPHPPRPPATAEEIPLDVRYEDDHLLFVNKPAGMVVHPAAGHHSGTLVNALLHRFDNLPQTASHRPGIVHRLDKDTSGIMVVAKSEYIMTSLGRLFHEHDIDREYDSLVWGDLPETGTIDAPLARHPGNRKKFAVVKGGRRAVSHWRVRERFGFATLITVTLETGRTHQIRVHFSSQGWPVFSDATYGGRMHALSRLTSSQRDAARMAMKQLDRQALHARLLGFIHPVTKQQIQVEAPLPEDFNQALELIREAK